ncbi:short-chain dehydrogenase, partial [Kouleothrix aurantiaca]
MQRLAGKIALVTGAARGIGQGIALCFAEEGADVLVNDLPPGPRTADAQGTVDSIAALGRRAHAHYADVSDRARVAGLFAAAVAQFGGLDIAVANAAISIREPTITADWEHVRRTIEVAQFGVYHTCQA